MILFIGLLTHVRWFSFLDLHQGVYVIKLNEKDEKILIYSISVGSSVSKSCDVTCAPKFIKNESI